MSVPVNVSFEVVLRFENDQIGNTWFSTAGGSPDVQLHMDREVYVALGSPQQLRVTVTPAVES